MYIYIPIYAKVVHKYLFECCPSDCHWQCILSIDSNPWDFPSAPACGRFRQTIIRPQVGSLWPWILRGPYANLFRGCCEAGVGWVQTVLERQQDLMLSTIIQSPQGFLSTNIRWKRCSKVMRVLGKAIMKTKVFDKNDALWKLKAYNGRVVCAWLAHATLKLARAAPSPERLILAHCMSPPEIFFWTSTGPHWAFWVEGQTSSLQLRLDSIALRCSASEVQVKIENAGRYLPLVWNYGFPVFTTIVIQMCKSLLIRPLCSRMTCTNHDEKYNKFQSVRANLLLKTFALLLTWYGLSIDLAASHWTLVPDWQSLDLDWQWHQNDLDWKHRQNFPWADGWGHFNRRWNWKLFRWSQCTRAQLKHMDMGVDFCLAGFMVLLCICDVDLLEKISARAWWTWLTPLVCRERHLPLLETSGRTRRVHSPTGLQNRHTAQSGQDDRGTTAALQWEIYYGRRGSD